MLLYNWRRVCLSEPHSFPVIHFIIFSRREQRCLRSSKCAVNERFWLRVIPKYLYCFTYLIVSLFIIRGRRGVRNTGWFVNTSPADLEGDIWSPHALHQAWTWVRASCMNVCALSTQGCVNQIAMSSAKSEYLI